MVNNTITGIKKSQFNSDTVIPSGSYFDFVVNGQNYRIRDTDFYAALGVTGTIVQDGDPTGAPVLDVQGAVNAIRNIVGGDGIQVSIDAQNSIQVDTDFSFNNTGAALVDDVLSASPAFRSLVAGSDITISEADGTITISSAANTPESIIYVTEGSQLTGSLDSSKVYVIDGNINMTGLGSITVPNGGLTIEGFGFNVSSLICSDSNYTLFIGGGSLNLRDMAISISGSSSRVYNLTAATGDEAIEIDTLNYDSCTSLGEINGYRQGLEVNTGRFGGTPSLTLSGTWNGFRISTSISRGISALMTNAFFKEGTSLSITGRFITDINCDLGATAAFCDFSPSNFTQPSSFIIRSALFQRNGSIDADDATIIPNIDASDVEARFKDNSGITNTFEGGKLTITSSSATALSGVAIGAFLDVAGTYTAAFLDHFASPSNGQLENLAQNPREFEVDADLVVSGTANDEIQVKIVKWDDSASSFVDVETQTRAISNSLSGLDVAYFDIGSFVNLDDDDYVKIQVANTTAARNVTALTDSSLLIKVR